MDFFNTLAPMRGYQGDTFPFFRVFVSGSDAEDLSDCSMRFVMEDKFKPGDAVLVKNCTYFQASDQEGFKVQLESSETADLCGVYIVHFILTDTNGLEYRRLDGTLEVLPSPREE